MQAVNAGTQYMEQIMRELSGHQDDKRVLGIVIDRALIQRIFGGSISTIPSLAKTFNDQ